MYHTVYCRHYSDYQRLIQFLGMLTKLRKVAVRSVMSVCRSARMVHRGFHCTNFYEI